MPVKITKTGKKDGYRVSTPGGTKAKNTTKKKAEAQGRFLRGIEHGMVPRQEKRKGLPGRKKK